MRTIIALLFCMFALTACGSSEARPLDGQWSAKGFRADISDNRIEVAIVGDNTASVYWDGSAPTGEPFGYGWFMSDANERALDKSVLGSTADEKKFTYNPKDDTLSFEIRMMGTTKTVVLERS